MIKSVYKYNCSKCANRNIIEKKFLSLWFGIIDESYCSNKEKVIFENHPKCETEIYCKNYKEKEN